MSQPHRHRHLPVASGGSSSWIVTVSRRRCRSTMIPITRPRWTKGIFHPALRDCTLASPGPRASGTSPAWLTRLHDTFWVSYQPAGRYWVFQSVVGGGTLLVACCSARS